MMFKNVRDWKQYLTPEDEDKLNGLLKLVAKNRGAYKNADDVKLAQLWSAALELFKQNYALQKRIADLEDVLEAVVDTVKKRENEKKNFIKKLEREEFLDP